MAYRQARDGFVCFFYSRFMGTSCLKSWCFGPTAVFSIDFFGFKKVFSSHLKAFKAPRGPGLELCEEPLEMSWCIWGSKWYHLGGWPLFTYFASSIFGFFLNIKLFDLLCWDGTQLTRKGFRYHQLVRIMNNDICFFFVFWNSFIS